jgi:hypothetical protein
MPGSGAPTALCGTAGRGVWLATPPGMLLRRRSHRFFTASSKLLWPAVALGILALALQRRSHAAPPLPRLPVRRKPPSPSSSRLRRLSAPPADVELPGAFWDASGPESAQENDPAEIPGSSPLVSQASQAAANVGPGAFYHANSPLRW